MCPLYRGKLRIIILGEEEQVGEWDNVISITENIITKIQQFGGEILLADPIEFMHLNLIPEKDKSKKQKKSRKIELKNLQFSEEDKGIIAEFNKLKEDTKEEFRKRFALIKEYKQLMQEEYNAGVYDTAPKISTKDIIDYIYNETTEKVSDQTLYRTKQYGKLGLLD